jgi:fermentation-respiration switch protein FrsA (DUF1100 family)
MTPAAHYHAYASTHQPGLMLYTVSLPAPGPAPLLLRMHGWHGSVKAYHPDNVDSAIAGTFNEIHPEMRGRGDSAGHPDANGWELHDAVDALAAHAARFPATVAPGQPPLLWGGSGGGGNVLGLLGKFPDTFAVAVAECGMSDYGLWFADDHRGEFRDEMAGANWIGGTPWERPEAYLSRGGRTTALNLLTPLLLIHGEEDRRVPCAQTRAYVAACRHHQRERLLSVLTFPGVGDPGHFSNLDAAGAQRRQAAIASHLLPPHRAPRLPARGRLVVAGYLVTAAFRVTLEAIDQVALLEYDLAAERFALLAPSSRTATVEAPGAPARTVACAPLPLADLCHELGVPNPATYADIQRRRG